MKYVCTICGYVYDEAEQKVPFSDLPDSWICPLCGAPKALFVKQENGAAPEPETAARPPASSAKKTAPDSDNDVLKKLTPGELSALFSNLAKSCEKQYQEEAKNCFQKIADYFEDSAPDESDADINRLSDLIRADLDENYKTLKSVSDSQGDRGAARVVVWGEKATRIAKSLVDRYIREGGAFMRNTGFYVCTVCGFLYVGDAPPERCPVCRVPAWRFEKIAGRAS